MNNRIKRIFSVITVLVISTLCSCGEQKHLDADSYFQRYNFKATDYIELCDYKNITVDSNYVEVTNSDIVTVIEMDMEYYNCMKKTELNIPEEDLYVFIRIDDIKNSSSKEQYYLFGSEEFGSQFEANLKETSINKSFVAKIDGIESKITNMGIYEPATIEDEEIILNFYELNSMEEVYEYIREKTKNNIIFHYMMDVILEKIEINDLPLEISKFYDEYSAPFWNDILVYKAILEKEGQELTVIEFEQVLETTARENNSTVSAILEENADYVLHFALEKKIKSILIGYINIK